MTAQYSPDNVHIIWKGVPLTGFAKDTFVEIEREEDSFTTYVGSGGQVCRTKNLNRLGKITVTLMAVAPVNDILAALAQTDEDTGFGSGPITVKDLGGTMLASGADAWVMKRPKIERAHESGTIQWVFVVASLQQFEGGSLTQ
jgi:hypothetical protein